MWVNHSANLRHQNGNPNDTDTGPQTTVKALGKGSGKDGRPLVADLIRLRENESKSCSEIRTNAPAQSQLQADLCSSGAEFAKRLERMDSLTKANVSQTQTLG